MKIMRSGHHQQPLEYKEYPQNEKNCVVHCPKEHINRTHLIWGNMDNGDQLILSYTNIVDCKIHQVDPWTSQDSHRIVYCSF